MLGRNTGVGGYSLLDNRGKRCIYESRSDGTLIGWNGKRDVSLMRTANALYETN